MNKSNLKEPLVRIVKRDNIKVKNIILIYSIAIIGGLLLSGFISMLFSDKGLFDFFQSLFEGAFGSDRKFWLLLQDTSLLLGTSMALLPAFKMKFWNLGGNGQILVGCLSAIACMFYLGGKVNDGIIILLMFFSSIFAGALCLNLIDKFVPHLHRFVGAEEAHPQKGADLNKVLLFVLACHT